MSTTPKSSLGPHQRDRAYQLARRAHRAFILAAADRTRRGLITKFQNCVLQVKDHAILLHSGTRRDRLGSSLRQAIVASRRMSALIELLVDDRTLMDQEFVELKELTSRLERVLVERHLPQGPVDIEPAPREKPRVKEREQNGQSVPAKVVALPTVHRDKDKIAYDEAVVLYEDAVVYDEAAIDCYEAAARLVDESIPDGAEAAIASEGTCNLTAVASDETALSCKQPPASSESTTEGSDEKAESELPREAEKS